MLSAMCALRTMLREATAADHARLERRLGLLDGTLTRARHRRVLAAMLGFFGPLELRLCRAPESPLHGETLCRTAWLQQDLAALGSDPAHLRALRYRPAAPIASAGDAAGRSYVLEGMMLGGQVVGPHLRRTLGIGPCNGGAFHHGWGQGTERRWRAFLATIEAGYARGAVDAVAASEAARGVFTDLEQWLDEHGVLARAIEQNGRP
jgi:heme oxygenase (biliverdin-IX-beta and delta-forming)